MPRLDVRPELITIRLAWPDRLLALRGDVQVRRDAVHGVEAVADAMQVAEDQVWRRRADQPQPHGLIGQQPDPVVVPDRADGDAHVVGRLRDRQHGVASIEGSAR
ncbi:hypothetical protein [Arsenicicoccus dermatophilus]|uniref:hypothetical protein n=1 Tax=Arsenicicoccus dermatophilus TaxID=1076331 RepID=UPI0039172729